MSLAAVAHLGVMFEKCFAAAKLSGKRHGRIFFQRRENLGHGRDRLDRLRIPTKVFDVSMRASANNMPMAEKFPGSGGITTSGI